MSENYQKITLGLYVVRTQAGFAKAVKDFSEGDSCELRGFPTAYPSFVSLSHAYNGSTYIQANCVHINVVVEAIAKSEAAAPART